MKTILHTVNQSPFTGHQLQQCLDHFSHGDALVFLEDGVYSALSSHAYTESLSSLSQCYAIKNDIDARGIAQDQLLPNITLIDYDQFVGLSLEHPLFQSWF